MIRYGLTTTMAALALFIGSTAFSQSSETYFRYFKIEAEASVNQNEWAQGLFEGTPYSVFSQCPERSAILIRVSANYPKRTKEMKEEILAKLRERLPSEDITGVETYKATEVEIFCQ